VRFTRSYTFHVKWLLLALTVLMAFALPCMAQGWGEVRMAEQVVNVRQSRSAQAPLVRSLQPGDKVKVDFIRGGWGALFDLNETDRDETKAIGFADVRLLAAPAQMAATARSGAVGGEVKLVEARTEVRKDRSAKSQVVAVLAAGEQVRTGFERDGWLALCRMNDPVSSEASAIGYVPVGMVRSAAREGAKPGTPAKPASGTKAPAAKAEGKSAPAPEIKGEVKEGSLLGEGQPLLNKSEPVRITSDKLVYNQAGNAVVFEGNVHATHGAMSLWSTKVTAYFTDKAKAKAKDKTQPGGDDMADKIERIVADGNVRMVANKNEGQCATLTYFVAEGMMRMDGNPILKEGQNTVRGDVIKFYVRENRSEVLSGKERRVEAIFYSPSSEKK
jgi:lipopolysaccharide export system protein LptA